MRFNDPRLQTALGQWRQMTQVVDRSRADNIWFEDRVSAARQELFEREAGAATDAIGLQRAHADYWETFVKVDGLIPHTFLETLAPADLGPIDEGQTIIRIEDLTRPLEKHGMTFEELDSAFTRNDAPVIDGFLSTWNTSMRDSRPSFAAFKHEVKEDLDDASWPSRLRDRLGLAHYTCAAGAIPIALMEYSVAEIRAAASAAGVAAAFTSPTVFDSGPWPFFFPAPIEMYAGRTMALFEVDDDRELLAEILHFRITYSRDHLARLDKIRTPTRPFDLRNLRNHHLLALHIACGRDDFGEEVPA